LSPVLSFPPFRLDPTDERLWRDEHEIPLRRKPFAILRYFAGHPRRLVTHDELVEAVWGKVAMSESLLRTHIRELRHAVGDGIVETVVGRGYRFVPEVAEVADHAPVGPGEPRPSQLVGRDDAMEALHESWKAALGGQRRIVFVTGESGIGKSALAEAFLSEFARRSDVWIARGTCVEQYGAGEPYLPLLVALGSAARSSTGPRLVAVLGRHAPSWLMQMPELVADRRAEVQDRHAEPTAQLRMLRELAGALEVLTEEQPAVLLLEDLQWADDSTAELLAMLGQRCEPARLLILGTFRETDVAKTHPIRRVANELEAHGRATVLRLEGLSESAVAEYLARRYPTHALPSDLAHRVQEPTGGNPLFIVGLLSDLERRQVLKVIDGRWQFTIPVDEVAAHRPDTITRLIDIQIDRLSDREQRLLEVAAAAGSVFTTAVIAFALDLEADLVESICEALANARHFLRAMGTETWPDGTVQYRYGFVHAMFQSAALARSSSASIRLWHRRFGERLEASYGNETESIAAELAVHFDEGHEHLKAAHYYVTAAERAVRRFGTSSALRQFERARELVRPLPAGAERDALELRVLRNLAPISLATRTDAHLQLVPMLTRAVELATRLGDDASLASALSALQTCRLRSGAFHELEKHVEEASMVAKRLGDPVLLAEATVSAAHVRLNAGDLHAARDTFDELVSAVEQLPSTWHVARAGNPENPAINVRWSRGWVAWLLGYPDDGLARAQHALSLARSLGEPYSIVIASAGLATLQMLCRDPAGALESVRGMVAFATDNKIPYEGNDAASAVQALVCWATTDLDPGAGEALVDQLVPPSGWAGVLYRLPLIEVCARTGRQDRALEELSVGLAYAEDNNLRVWVPEFFRLRGEVLASTDPRAAEQSIAQAIALARSQSSMSFELRAALSLYRVQPTRSRKKSLAAVRRLYGSFTEGFAMPDLLDAKAILDRSDRSARR